MKLAYTSSFSVDTNGVTIVKGETPGNGVIPNTIKIRAIQIVPEQVAGAYPTYHIKGLHADSDWLQINPESPIYAIEGLTDDTGNILHVKADSGTITIKLHVKGQ